MNYALPPSRLRSPLPQSHPRSPGSGCPYPRWPPARQQCCPPAHPAGDDVQTLKVNVNLVNVYFSVRDKAGYITNLHKDDCAIYEDKALQKTKNFTQEKNLPLTIGILLDTSGSMQNVLPLEQQAGAEFLKEVLTPKDEAFLISFDINVDLLADYTNSPRELKRSLDKASINTGAGTGSVTGNGSARGTLLYDAVYLAAHDKLHQEAGRKILVLLTDGDDQGSQETLKTVHRGRPEGQRHRLRHPHRRPRLLRRLAAWATVAPATWTALPKRPAAASST